MIEELQDYYDRLGISAMGFACPHYDSCRAGSAEMVEAKEAFVPVGYVEHRLPRLLFVSGPPGSHSEVPGAQGRTMAAVRDAVAKDNVADFPKHRHWSCTFEQAWIILGAFRPGLSTEQVKPHFAHTTSCKCRFDSDSHVGPDLRFRNCRPYIPGEIELLEPDILVTQGNAARDVVEGAFAPMWRRRYLADAPLIPDCEVIAVGGGPVLWLHTPLPRHGALFKRLREVGYPQWPEIVRVFIEKSGRWRAR